VREQEQLAALLRERSIRFGDFTLASGQHSSYYIDARKTTMSAAGQLLIGRLGLATIRRHGWSPAAVGGLTMGADPIAVAIARASVEEPPLVEAFSVRKAAKEHGTGRRIEGNFQPGAAVVVIEDVITTGGSALEAIKALQHKEASILGVLCLVDREQGGGQALQALGINVVALTTTTDLGIA
jgi:orotate phosphoribosyltransferase